MQISRDLYNLARREMNELAKASGGKNFLAASLQDARAAFARVATEIGTQYSLGYYPTNKARDGKFRTIRVEVQGAPDKAAGSRARRILLLRRAKRDFPYLRHFSFLICHLSDSRCMKATNSIHIAPAACIGRAISVWKMEKRVAMSPSVTSG